MFPPNVTTKGKAIAIQYVKRMKRWEVCSAKKQVELGLEFNFERWSELQQNPELIIKRLAEFGVARRELWGAYPVLYGLTLDKGKVYKRKHWGVELAMAWSVKFGYWAYIRAYDYYQFGNLIYKNAHHAKNDGKFSKVGDTVLEAKDLTEIGDNPLTKCKDNKKEEEKIMAREVNYTGAYGVCEVMLAPTDYFYTKKEEVLANNTASTYTFKVDLKLIKKLKPYDLVVVETSNGIVLGAVKTVYGTDISQETIAASNRAKAWVVNKVDTKAHQERIDKTERKKFIMQELESRKQAIEEAAIWKMLAQQDETASKLLAELEALNK